MANMGGGAGAEHRVAQRTNLMLAATVESGGRVNAVRIRNLSETGALIEGSGLPGAGASMILKRGDLQVASTIAWASGERRGVRFDSPTPVQEWTGGKIKLAEPGGLRDQKRVDAFQAEARTSTPPAPERVQIASDPAGREQLDSRLADELAYVQRLLETVGDELIAEPLFVQRHAQTLQGIDLASQILTHVAAIIVAQNREEAIERIGMEDLRARLKRKAVLAR
jgi:hypothetical protein